MADDVTSLRAPDRWQELEEPPDLSDAPAPPGCRWWACLEELPAGHELYAVVWGDGTPEVPLHVMFLTVGAPPWYPALELIGPALELLMGGGAIYMQTFPPCIVGAPGDFDANAAAAPGMLQLMQCGALAGSPAATRWELGGGRTQGQRQAGGVN